MQKLRFKESLKAAQVARAFSNSVGDKVSSPEEAFSSVLIVLVAMPYVNEMTEEELLHEIGEARRFLRGPVM